MFEFATSSWDICKSCLMVSVIYREVESGLALLSMLLEWRLKYGQLTRGGKAYHDRNATMNPSHEKKNTRPYGSIGLRMGIDLAFLLMGFTSGETKSNLRGLRPMLCSFPKGNDSNTDNW